MATSGLMRLSVLRHMDIELQYVRFTVAVTEWRTKFRRNMNTRDNAVRQKVFSNIALVALII